MKILVASTNPGKIQAVEQGFIHMYSKDGLEVR